METEEIEEDGEEETGIEIEDIGIGMTEVDLEEILEIKDVSTVERKVILPDNVLRVLFLFIEEKRERGPPRDFRDRGDRGDRGYRGDRDRYRSDRRDRDRDYDRDRRHRRSSSSG